MICTLFVCTRLFILCYCDSVKSFNSGIDSVSDDLEKLKLGSIEEQYHEYVAGEKTDLYEPLDNENAKVSQRKDFNT
jgi:hypothetical protein